MQQVPFDFGSKLNFSTEDFVLSKANQEAFIFVNEWPNWGTQRFSKIPYIYGAKGCGKTHLANIWQQRVGAVFLKPIEVMNRPAHDLLNNSSCFILEDLDKKISEEPLLHLVNTVIEEKKFLLITASVSPPRLAIKLPDLRSRMNSLQSFKIGLPDYELLGTILMKNFSDRQIRVSPEVVNFILMRTERSFQAVQELVKKIDKKSLSERRNVTIPFVKEFL